MANFFDRVKPTISNKQVKSAWFGTIYSEPGAGKSWLAGYAPNPFCIATEKGCELVPNIAKFTETIEGTAKEKLVMPANDDEFFDIMRHFITTDHDYKTIVIDGGKFTEQLFIAGVIKRNPYETVKKEQIKVECLVDYNFSRGHEKVMELWVKFFVGVKALRNKGINVLLLAHAAQRTATTTSGDEYKRTEIDQLSFGRINVGNLIMAESDFVYFIRNEAKTNKIKQQFGGTKTIALDGSKPDIVLYTRPTSAFLAKTRTADKNNIPDYYVLDWDRPETSQIIFDDLSK